MEQERTLYIRMAEAFREHTFLQKLSMTQSDVDRHFGGVIWNRLLSPLMPMEARLSCSQALEAFRPLLAELAPTPAEGWLKYAYQVAVSLLYPQMDQSSMFTTPSPGRKRNTALTDTTMNS